MRFRKYVTAFMLLAVSWAANSQTTKSLTLDEAVKIGIEASQQLKATGAKLDVTKAKTLQFRNAQLPDVSLKSAYTRLSDNITPYSFKLPGMTDALVLNPQILNQFSNGLSLQQYVFTGFRAKYALESAVFLEKAATLDVEKDRIEVKNNIISAYLNLLKLQTSKAVFTENIHVLRGRLGDVKNFVKSGTALENDQLKAEIAVSQIELSLKEVENAIEVANFNMNLMLGLPLDTRLELDNSVISTERELADLNTYLQSIDTRPDLTATDLRHQATLKNVEIAKGAKLPTLAIGGNLLYANPNPRIFPAQDVFKGTWDLGLQLSYNLTSLYTTKAQVAEAQANVMVSNAQKQELTNAAKMEVNANYYAYQSARDKVDLMQKTIAQTTENQRVVKNRYQTHVATIGELLDADGMVLQAKLNLEIAKTDAIMTYYKLQKSVGK